MSEHSSASVVDPDGVELRRVDCDEITDPMAAEMIAVFRGAFGRWPFLDPGVSALDHLRWKTSGSFTRIGSLQARADGRIVFATTAWASWMRIGGARRLRVIFSDTAMDPAYQGRRIYSRSVEYRRRLVTERYDLSLHERGSSVRNQRPLGRKGQTPIANSITRRYRILRPLAFCAERGRRELTPAAAVLAAAGALTAAARRGALRRRGLEPSDENRFDHRFDALFEAAAADFDVIGERTQDFLRWRYGDRRAGPFVVRSIVEGDRLLGYAIVRLDGRNAYVADLLAQAGRTDAVEIARRAGAAGIECWLSGGHPYRRALARQGFFDSRVDVGVEYHPVEASAEDLKALRDPRARVHFQLGDTDLV